MLPQPYGAGGGTSRQAVRKIIRDFVANPNQVRIRGVNAAAGANAINGTTNTSVPLFDDANLVQTGDGIDVTATADGAASGTLFTILRPGVYYAKFTFTAAASQDLVAAIARDPTDPISGLAQFGGEAGVFTGAGVLTPAATEASVTVEGEVIVTPADIRLGNNLVVPLVTLAAGGSPDEEDFASSADLHFELSQTGVVV